MSASGREDLPSVDYRRPLLVTLTDRLLQWYLLLHPWSLGLLSTGRQSA